MATSSILRNYVSIKEPSSVFGRCKFLTTSRVSIKLGASHGLHFPQLHTDQLDNISSVGLPLADVDPATTAKVAIAVVGPALSGFGLLFIARIVMSWYPSLPVGKFPYVIAYAPTEPILAVTRKVIRPLGGVDVTPVVWFGLISFLNEILVGPQGLLVLLSQQIN